jgi:hypothetical protein
MEILHKQLHKMCVSVCVSLCEIVGLPRRRGLYVSLTS